ncbi:MAG: hypothetical protein ABSA17_02850 [Rhabdochlamydiaceae bacterium]
MLRILNSIPFITPPARKSDTVTIAALYESCRAQEEMPFAAKKPNNE